MPPEVVAAGVQRLLDDPAAGEWERRHGRLRNGSHSVSVRR
jgi:hypothetical protein